MAYTKQNFENGQILTAEQLNHMEQGIEDASNAVVDVFTNTLKVASAKNPDVIDNTFVHVSDEVIPREALLAGGTAKIVGLPDVEELEVQWTGEDVFVEPETVARIMATTFSFPLAWIAFETITVEGITMERGINFMHIIEGDSEIYVDSVTFNGYSFATRKIAPSLQHQSDWNQNDKTAPDYIKNKPFYTVSEKTYMGSIEFAGTDTNKMECTYSNSDSTFGYLNRLVNLGEIVEVEIFKPTSADPVAVGTVALTQDRAYLQFNGALSGSVHRSDGSVLTVTVNVADVSLPAGRNYTIKFYDTTVPIYKTIEEKYLPEGVPYAGSKILFAFNYDGNPDGKITTHALGKQWVKISGLVPRYGELVGATAVWQELGPGEVSYTVTAVQSMGTDTGSDGGALLVITEFGFSALVISEPGTYAEGTFPEIGTYVPHAGEEYVKTLYKAETVIRPADPRCIVLTSPNGTKFNLTVSDDGTLSATPVS